MSHAAAFTAIRDLYFETGFVVSEIICLMSKQVKLGNLYCTTNRFVENAMFEI